MSNLLWCLSAPPWGSSVPPALPAPLWPLALPAPPWPPAPPWCPGLSLSSGPLPLHGPGLPSRLRFASLLDFVVFLWSVWIPLLRGGIMSQPPVGVPIYSHRRELFLTFICFFCTSVSINLFSIIVSLPSVVSDLPISSS